ncbi:MAG: type II secretion system protein [Patescibacteria group bacterium]|jgi:prepilin-type N-terminal cleavage/methylation domain-containing protein
MTGDKKTRNQEIKKSRNQLGFTLMEVLVVLGIFSILGVLIIDVFLLALQSQRQVSARQKTLSNLRYVIEDMARQVRTSEIDYASYTGGVIEQPATQLVLIDQEGKRVVYELIDNEEIQLTVDTESAPVTNPTEVKVEKLSFYINPITDPFYSERCNGPQGSNGCLNNLECTINESADEVGFCICSLDSDCATKNCDDQESLCLPFNQQPIVTIVLGFKSVGPRLEEEKVIYLQTTAVSRVYKR